MPWRFAGKDPNGVGVHSEFGVPTANPLWGVAVVSGRRVDRAGAVAESRGGTLL
ncbi:hypothetical protein Prubr_66590 [Polymorphospora rubra]|uniref:Uncharacterized protein n=1 Tax=Polymorphospora rubra TaxID=338584 RepID=A0A810NCP1_9ACTN|nr:hypothetical protein Prubr_66590 [Polymorphospora rubra]